MLGKQTRNQSSMRNLYPPHHQSLEDLGHRSKANGIKLLLDNGIQQKLGFNTPRMEKHLNSKSKYLSKNGSILDINYF